MKQVYQVYLFLVLLNKFHKVQIMILIVLFVCKCFMETCEFLSYTMHFIVFIYSRIVQDRQMKAYNIWRQTSARLKTLDRGVILLTKWLSLWNVVFQECNKRFYKHLNNWIQLNNIFSCCTFYYNIFHALNLKSNTDNPKKIFYLL